MVMDEDRHYKINQNMLRFYATLDNILEDAVIYGGPELARAQTECPRGIHSHFHLKEEKTEKELEKRDYLSLEEAVRDAVNQNFDINEYELAHLEIIKPGDSNLYGVSLFVSDKTVPESVCEKCREEEEGYNPFIKKFMQNMIDSFERVKEELTINNYTIRYHKLNSLMYDISSKGGLYSMLKSEKFDNSWFFKSVDLIGKAIILTSSEDYVGANPPYLRKIRECMDKITAKIDEKTHDEIKSYLAL